MYICGLLIVIDMNIICVKRESTGEYQKWGMLTQKQTFLQY